LKYQCPELLGYGVCSICGSIGYHCNNEDYIIASDAEIWIAQQVAELIANFPDAANKFSKEKLIEGLNSLVDIFANGMSARAARKIGMQKSVIWAWIHGSFLPSLSPLIDLCMAAELSLVSVLMGQPVKCEAPNFEKKPTKTQSTKPLEKDREEALKNGPITNNQAVMT
jgi:hypothetical protein